jgi:hypothetical protein
MQQLTEIEVDGRTFSVNIRNTGVFSAEFDSGEIKAESLKELIAALRKAVKKANAHLCIRFSQLDGVTIRRGTITGVHGRTNNYLVTWDNGQKEQVGSYSEFLKLTEEEERNYAELMIQKRSLETKIRAIQQTKKIDVKAKLAEQIAAE